MAPKPSPALLFHPKKPAKQQVQQTSPAKVPVPNSRPKLTKPKDNDEEELKLPEGPYQEFKLLSSALNGWKYDVMKFDSRRPVDVFRWSRPVKLNRKDLRRDEASNNVVPEAVAPMLGPDGKPVIGADGRTVMVDSEGRPIHTTNNAAESSQDKGGKGAKDKKRFTKKTRQVYFVPEEVRQLRREERYPWVMEDSSPSQNEIWIGQMEDASKSETHAFFMPAANDVFKFVPAHRWYKFQKRLKHDLPTDSASMESLVFTTPCNIRELLISFVTSSILLRSEIRKRGWLLGMEGKDLLLRLQLCSKQRLKDGRSRLVAHWCIVVVKV
jgi:transcription initiation factor TFIIF subunit alpha